MRARSPRQTITNNFWLHIYSSRVHRYSLKPLYTLGLGVACACSLVILFVTGILLMLYYHPSVSSAYESVKDIHYVVYGGRFIRNLHRWATNVLLICVFLHMVRVFYTAAYKKTRQFNWLIGIGLLILSLFASFSGYLLPWDQLAYWAATIASNIAASTREITDIFHITQNFDIGGFQRLLFLGSNEVGQNALIRFYWFHCIGVPIGIVALAWIHLWRIRQDGGLARPDDIQEDELKYIPREYDESYVYHQPHEREKDSAGIHKTKTPMATRFRDTLPSWPHLILRILTMLMLVLAVTCLLSYFINAPLKEPANPLVPENPAKSPWYFLAFQELISYSAFMGGLVIPTLVIIGLALIPYLDREEQQIGRWFDHSKGRQAALYSMIFTFALVVGLLALTVRFGWLRTLFPHIGQWVIVLINPGTIILVLIVAWSLFFMKRYQSTRIGAISLFTCFLAAFVILTYVALYHRGPNWDFYWLKSQWPVY
jgi:quinol-cytochrome oxidoreductase complex cytochrome b subunit